MTDIRENITFPQLLLRTVKKSNFTTPSHVICDENLKSMLITEMKEILHYQVDI